MAIVLHNQKDPMQKQKCIKQTAEDDDDDVFTCKGLQEHLLSF